MRSTAFAVALVATAFTVFQIPAQARAPAKLITADQKRNCTFIKFVATKSTSASGAAAAMNEALVKAAGYGADSYYVMNDTSGNANGGTVDGQALQCGK